MRTHAELAVRARRIFKKDKGGSAHGAGERERISARGR